MESLKGTGTDKMTELTTSRVQPLHEMDQYMVNVRQATSAQVSPLNNDVPMDVNAMTQAQVLHGRMLGEVPSPHCEEATKAEILTIPVKRQVTEAGNNQRNKRSHKAWNLDEEKQQGDIKTRGKCLCCEHHGRSCLQIEDSLMTAEVRQRYYADMSRRCCIHPC
jgi:hypothetical protein